MPYRKKILILQNDDFMRELLGNLLHKDGLYILNGSSIEKGLQRAEDHNVSMVILSSDCEDFDGKSSINYINKELETPEIFLINEASQKVSYHPSEDQMLAKDLSVQKIVQIVNKKTLG
jgi:DNA-binding NtrC family response regulator